MNKIDWKKFNSSKNCSCWNNSSKELMRDRWNNVNSILIYQKRIKRAMIWKKLGNALQLCKLTIMIKWTKSIQRNHWVSKSIHLVRERS
jgi:hypothetical protein